MPMGLPDAFRDGSNLFDQIVNRYSATIAALFFGRSFAILIYGKC
jgi:sphingomyelin phosphodiesterase